MIRVAVIATVKNEGLGLSAFLDALLDQTRKPDEIVIADGGSTDDTVTILTRFAERDPRVRVLSVPHANIAAGRNRAIGTTNADVIAVTDAGTIARPDWLERLVEPFVRDETTAVTSGFYKSGGATFFERCLTTVITPQLHDVDGRSFLPSSRSVGFRREWWARVHGYPEWLTHCEDLVFDMELKKAKAPFVFVPQAVVVWSARRNLKQFFRQYFNYAKGDGHARLYATRHAIRYSAYVLGLLLALAAVEWPTALLLLALGILLYFRKFARRLSNTPPGRGFLASLSSYSLLPIIVVTGDLAKMIGYPVGVLERVFRSRAEWSTANAHPDRAA